MTDENEWIVVAKTIKKCRAEIVASAELMPLGSATKMLMVTGGMAAMDLFAQRYCESLFDTTIEEITEDELVKVSKFLIESDSLQILE